LPDQEGTNKPGQLCSTGKKDLANPHPKVCDS